MDMITLGDVTLHYRIEGDADGLPIVFANSLGTDFRLWDKIVPLLPGGLKIQTIHSFCQSLLGRFPIEAKVTPQFSLLDDITINDLLRVSRDELLEDIYNGKQKELSDALSYISKLIKLELF